MESPVKLNDEYGVDYDNDREEVVIYANDSGHPPHRLLVLTEQQMWELNEWWIDEAVSIQQHQLSA